MKTGDEAREVVADLGMRCWAYSTLGAALEAGLLDDLEEPRTAAFLGERTGVPAELALRMLDVLVALKLVRREPEGFAAEPGFADLLRAGGRRTLQSDLRSTLLQGRDYFAAASKQRLARGWSFTDPDILEAQGAMSASFADAIVHKLMPHLEGLAERFAAPTAAFLDVGTGVGRIAIELCRLVPTLRVVGLEPFDAPMGRARQNVAEAGLRDRIELRSQRVEELSDRDAFDLAWVPQPFLPNDVLQRAFARARDAVRPGGWVLSGAYRSAADDLGGALLRLRTVLGGGDALAPGEVARMLGEAGLVGAKELPAPPLIPAQMVAARKA